MRVCGLSALLRRSPERCLLTLPICEGAQREPTPTHSFADGNGLLGQGLRVRDIVLHDGLEQLVFIFTVKRRLFRKREGGKTLRQFINVAPEAPAQHQEAPQAAEVARSPVGLFHDL